MRALVLAVIGATATSAFADDRDLARQEFALGQSADEQRDWQAALAHYQRANELVPHAFAIFNIASDYERLGKLREAARWYERYLEAAPDSPDRDKVVRLLADVERRPAPIAVHSTPPGGRVWIDSVPLGTTPYAGTISSGAHQIRVELAGEQQLKEATAAYGEPVDVVFAMGDDGSATPAPFRVAYLLGGSAGADLRSGSGVNAAEIGAGEYGLEATARLGKAVDLTSLELVVRWPLLGTRRVTPTLALGYAYVLGTDATSGATEVGAGYEALGGVRVAVMRRDRVAVLVGAEAGVRYHAISTAKTIVPMLASVLLEYR